MSGEITWDFTAADVALGILGACFVIGVSELVVRALRSRGERSS